MRFSARWYFRNPIAGRASIHVLFVVLPRRCYMFRCWQVSTAVEFWGARPLTPRTLLTSTETIMSGFSIQHN